MTFSGERRRAPSSQLIPLGLSLLLEHGEELGRSDDLERAEARITLMHQQIVVTGHQVIGFAGERREGCAHLWDRAVIQECLNWGRQGQRLRFVQSVLSALST